MTQQIIKAPIFHPPNIFKFYDIKFKNPLESDRIKIVRMEELGFITNNNDHYKYIGTFGIATCITLIGRCEHANITLVAHFSDIVNTDESIYILNKLLGPTSKLDIWLIGGFVGYSEPLFESIMSSLMTIPIFSFNIIKIEVMKSFICKNIAINIETSEIHDYVHYSKEIMEIQDICGIYKLPIKDYYEESELNQFIIDRS